MDTVQMEVQELREWSPQLYQSLSDIYDLLEPAGYIDCSRDQYIAMSLKKILTREMEKNRKTEARDRERDREWRKAQSMKED